MKKVLSVALSLILMLSLTSTAFAADNNEDITLSFGEDGKFTIMSVCDIQDVYPMEEATLVFLNEAIKEAKPDIVVLGGDNMVCKGTEIYDQMLSPFIENNIPFTLVFGNHDSQADQPSREWQLEQYQRVGGKLCLAYDAVPELHGCATHNLPVKSSDGTKTVFNLWMFDSGEYVKLEDGSEVYDCVRKDQIDWYKNVSTELEQQNGGKVPSLAFQHIIVKEVYDALFFKSPSFLAFEKFDDGSAFSVFPNLFKFSGIMFEPPCPSYFNEGQWDAFVERGDVLGCVTGHDHVNSFIASYKGVHMIQTPGVTHHSYSNDLNRGVRIITIDENNPNTYETDLLTCAEIGSREDSELSSVTGTSRFLFKLNAFFHDLCNRLMDLIVVGW